jgi:Mrp family chromosome partitioning ATPase
MSDATIIVTAINKTARDSVLKLKKAIENVGGKIAGVVLNKVPMKGREYTYQYYREMDPNVKKTFFKKRNKVNMKAKHR